MTTTTMMKTSQRRIACEQERAAVRIAMIGDKIVEFKELGPEWLDRGTFFGDGVYEAMRSKAGRIFALEEHLERFKRNLEAIDITGISIEQIRERVERAYSAAGIANAIIYFHITRGSALRSYFCDCLKPNFFLTIAELPDFSGEKKNGISVMTCPDLRWKRCDIKSLNLLPNVLAKRTATARGYDDAVFVDNDGLITEGASSAFFAIVNRVLRTTPLTCNILPSITRRFIFEISGRIDLGVVEEGLTVSEAAGADELFIATSPRGIVPVVKFNAETIGDGKVGRYTKLLSELLEGL